MNNTVPLTIVGIGPGGCWGALLLTPTYCIDGSPMRATWHSDHEPDKEDLTMGLSAVLTHAPEGGYVVFNPETGTTTQGDTAEEALANLREATEVYLEEFPITEATPPLLTTFQVKARA